MAKVTLLKTSRVSRSVGEGKGLTLFSCRETACQTFDLHSKPKKGGLTLCFVTITFDEMGVMERHECHK